MRLTSFLLLAFCLHLSARTHSQEITLSVRKAPLQEIFSAIKKQAGYFVFYKNELLKDAKPVSVSVYDMPLQDFLAIVLKDQGLNYEIADKTIMLSRKPDPSIMSDRNTLIVDVNLLPPVEIKGQVLADGKPIAGASITLNPGKKGTATDDKGFFSLTNVPAGQYTLQITSIGYQPIIKKITVGTTPQTLAFTMQPAIDQVEEVVITNGYSARKAGELTGSYQQITGDVLRNNITTSDPASLLKGLAPGLYISAQNEGDPTSSGGQIFVRGQSSIAGVGVDQVNQYIMPSLNYGPLLVLDGAIMPNQNLKELVSAQDIENITILKDAAATAIYGSRASGGVIIVTTKKGRDGKPRLTAEVKYGLNTPVRGSAHFDTGPELYALQKEYFTDDYQVNSASYGGSYQTLQDYLNYRLPDTADVARSYDWQKFAFLNSHTTEVNVGASGGNDRTKYYIGATYYNEQGTAIKNNLIRKSFRMNLDSKLSDKLTASISLNGILNDGLREQMNSGTFLYMLIPWANPYNANGTLANQLNYKLGGTDNIAANPLYDDQWNFDKPTSQLIFGSARLTYKITDWLSFSSNNSGNLNFTKDVQYMDTRSFVGGSPNNFGSPQGWLGTNTNQLISYLTSNQLNFHKTFGEHAITALAAMEYGKTSNNSTTTYVNHVQAGYPEISQASQIGGPYDYSAYGITATKAGNIEGGEEDQAVYSAFGEAEYTYRKRYSLSGSIRTDASSAFGANHRYGTFGSGGAAWIVSSENFMKDIKAVSNLKLRLNYGSSGSQLGDNFLTETLYEPGATYGAQNSGVIVANYGNPNLRWEVTKTLSGGVDLGLFNRINATIDAYDRRSDNLLQLVPLPALAGFISQWQNVASVRNTGLEVLINADIIKKKDFSWTASFNITFNRNRILSVPSDSLKQGFYSSSFYMYKGEDINSLKAVKYAGVDPQTGKPLFQKLLFDGAGHRTGVQLVDNIADVNQAADNRQMQTIGSSQPKYYGGLTNTFTYKQFSLNILITYTMKYIMNDLLASQMQAGYYFSYYNQLSFLKSQHLWTHPGQTNATDPWLYYQVNTIWDGTSKYLHDGSNAKLRSVRLSYNLPSSVLKSLKLANATFYLSGDNLYTKYSKNIVSVDPEGPPVGQAQTFGQSIGSSVAPPRRFLLGLQLNF